MKRPSSENVGALPIGLQTNFLDRRHTIIVAANTIEIGDRLHPHAHRPGKSGILKIDIVESAGFKTAQHRLIRHGC